MPQRLDYARLAPDATRALRELERYNRTSTIEPSLAKLVKLRASTMNGCAYCVDMHTKDARAAGESEQRLYAVPVWRETPFFTERERAALLWTEAVTELGPDSVSEELFHATGRVFSERELVDLTFVIVTINAWNRLAVGLGADVGSYQPPGAS
jgi:AhpD family alkylhydroperoxidase